ncbi:MAG TPA: DUF2934 domain-containing protein [Steroidobacteraceae bacterium]|nr:DUF2934 domain-containing protein [Steroidobacteraceae bacterium]
MPRGKIPATSSVRKRAPRKPATTPRAKRSATRFVGPEQRAALIAEAAFFRAEKRGFAPGHETEDWLAAEAEVDTRLMSALA